VGEANQVTKFRRLALVCECGRAPSHLKSVGLTSAHELLIHWKCAACRQPVYFVKSLSDCWRACREIEGRAESAPAGAECEFQPEDIAFLHSLHVAVPDYDTP
jgi:hypothetical protein